MRAVPVPDRGFIVSCDGPRRHQQTVYLPDHLRHEAIALGQLVDGTSARFRTSPREDPESLLARCDLCGALLRCAVFGYDDPAGDAR